MFWTVPLSIIRSFLLYTQQWYMSYRFADSLQAVSTPVWHIPLLYTGCSCQQTCMTYTFDAYRFADSLQAVSKPVWHIPLLCAQWRTPDDGQRDCPKHVQFHSKMKTFEKLVHLVGSIIRKKDSNNSKCFMLLQLNIGKHYNRARHQSVPVCTSVYPLNVQLRKPPLFRFQYLKFQYVT
jgi:hypothetical protein